MRSLLINNENKDTFIFSKGIQENPIPLFSGGLGTSWSFENNTFSFKYKGENIQSLYCNQEGKEGYKIVVDNYPYYLSLNDDFSWEDYEDSDFN